MRLRIPTRFMLHGQWIDVTYSEAVASQEGTLGMAYTDFNKIVLQKDSNGFRRNISLLEETFLHELVHFILFHMGRSNLAAEETFVENFAQLLHQALTTATYTNNQKKQNAKTINKEKSSGTRPTDGNQIKRRK